MIKRLKRDIWPIACSGKASEINAAQLKDLIFKTYTEGYKALESDFLNKSYNDNRGNHKKYKKQNIILHDSEGIILITVLLIERLRGELEHNSHDSISYIIDHYKVPYTSLGLYKKTLKTDFKSCCI